jgi:hypothetical protein
MMVKKWPHPYAYLKNSHALPIQQASDFDQLLPHNGQPVWLLGRIFR